MAESNLQAPLFRTATGGLADDMFTGIDGSFYSSKNIDIRTNGKGISLNKALVKDSSTTVVGKIKEIIKLTTGAYLAVGDSAGIYRKVGSTWTKVTTSTSGDILSVTEFNGYVYWTTATTLNRILIANVATRASEVLNFNALVSAPYHPLLVSEGDLYIGNGSKIDKVNISNVFEAKITMETGSVIKFISDLGGSIRVTTISAKGTNNIYLWNGISDTPDQTIPLVGYDIRQSVIFNGYQYLITNKGLGILDGYKIFQIKESEGFNNNTNSITIHNESLYIGGTGGIYVYGSKNKNYPEVLNFDIMTSNGNIADVIGAIYSDGTDLYVSWSNGSTYGIDKLSTTTYYTTGELILRGYYGRSMHEVKEAINISLGYKKPITGQSYVFSYSIDGTNYVNMGTIDSTTVTKNLFTEDMFIREQFQYILLKITLNGPGTSTPEFYSADLLFNGNINR